MPSYAGQVWPVPNRFINVGKEPQGQPGTVTTGTYTFPMTQWKPVDKITYLEDSAWRNAMAELYNLIQGVRIADISCGGPLFADGIGYPLLDITGDYYQAVNGTPGSSTTLSGSTSLYATQIVVANSGGFVNGRIISVGATNTTAEEVRQITAVAGGPTPGTLTLNAALYQGHVNGAVVIAYPTVTNIVHNFTLLNSGTGAGGWTSSQPPTYTYEDFTGVPLTTGARNYAYSCFSELSISGEATGLVMWDGKITAIASVIAPTIPTTTISSIQPQPSWNTTVTLAGAGTLNNADYKLTLTRKIAPKFTNSGQQDPFAIVRGYFGAALSLNFDPAADESEFLYYINNTQPTAQIVSSNGLAGSNAANITIKAQVAAFDTGELNDTKDVFAFDTTVKCVANTTNTGPSGGFSPVLISLTNGVINY